MILTFLEISIMGDTRWKSININENVHILEKLNNCCFFLQLILHPERISGLKKKPGNSPKVQKEVNRLLCSTPGCNRTFATKRYLAQHLKKTCGKNTGHQTITAGGSCRTNGTIKAPTRYIDFSTWIMSINFSKKH